MKNNNKIILWAVALLAIILLIFAKPTFSGSVIGTINPHGSAVQVWLYSGTDTLRSNIEDDVFEIPAVKAGVYTLVVEPNPTYKTVSLAGLNVNDGKVTNVGEIIMEQGRK